MSHREPWAEHFQISDEQLERWRKLAVGGDVLHFALQAGELDQSSYLQWASQHYQLAYVSPDFFAAGPDRELWTRFQSAGPWQPAVQPLHLWEDVLIVGCERPVTLPPQPTDFRFVLAPASFLQTNWDELVGSGVGPSAGSGVGPVVDPDASTFPGDDAELAAAEPAPPPPAESEVDDDVTASFVLNESGQPVLDGSGQSVLAQPSPQAESGSDPIPTPESVAEFEMPEGFAISFDEPAAAARSSFALKETPLEAAGEAPEGFDLALAPAEEPSAPASAEPPKAEAEPSAVSGPQPKLAPRPFPKRDAGVNKEDLNVSPLELTQTTTHPASRPTVMKGAAAPGEAAPKFDDCQSYEQVAEAAFRLVQPPYQRAMMLVFQGGLLKPWRWTTEFQASKDKPHPIDLERPSVFRIVYNSMLPYHGRVVPNDVNSRFFDQLDGGRIPAHLTIVPILVDKQMAAMLLAATDAEISVRASLALMERVGDQMGAALKSVRGSKPQAA